MSMKKIYAFLFCAAISLSLAAQSYHNGTWFSYYDTDTHKMNTISNFSVGNFFTPTAGQVSFNWKYVTGGHLKVDLLRSNTTIIYQSSDNGSEPLIIGQLTDKDWDTEYYKSLTIQTDCNWMKWDRPTGNTYEVQVWNIAIPLAKHILLASGTNGATTVSHNFGEVEQNTVSDAYMVTLRSFLTDGDIIISSSDTSNFRIGDAANTSGVVYEVGANACASANGTADAAKGGTLGKIDNYNFPIYFTPQKGGDFEAAITITDGTSTAIVTVTGTSPKNEQQITWNEEQNTLLSSGTIATASASSELEVTYTFSPEGIVSFDEGAFVILSEGKVQITASQAGNDIYYPAEPVSKFFTIYPAEVLNANAAEICEDGFYADPLFGNISEAGVYTDTLHTIHGGDSIVTLTLTVHPLFASEEEKIITVGDPETWQDMDLSLLSVGDTTLTAAYRTIYGCDSTYTLYLTVKPRIITYGNDTIYACSGETVEYEGKTYKRTTNDTITLAGQNYAGGDSLVLLAVIFSQSFSAEAFLTITEGDEETWQDMDLSLLPVGDTTLMATYQTIHGCDSTYTLYLTVEEKVDNTEALPATIAEHAGDEKVLINGTIYIRKGDALFDLSGHVVN